MDPQIQAILNAIKDSNDSMLALARSVGSLAREVDDIGKALDDLSTSVNLIGGDVESIRNAVLSGPSVESSSSGSLASLSGLFDGIVLRRSYRRKVSSQTKFVMEELIGLCYDVAREHQLDVTRIDEVNIRDNVWGRAGIIVEGILSNPDVDPLRTTWSAMPETTLKAREDLESTCQGFAPLAACVNSWAANKILQLRWDRAITYKRRVAQGGVSKKNILTRHNSSTSSSAAQEETSVSSEESSARQHREVAALPSTPTTDVVPRLMVSESEDEETAQLPSLLLSLHQETTSRKRARSCDGSADDVSESTSGPRGPRARGGGPRARGRGGRGRGGRARGRGRGGN